MRCRDCCNCGDCREIPPCDTCGGYIDLSDPDAKNDFRSLCGDCARQEEEMKKPLINGIPADEDDLSALFEDIDDNRTRAFLVIWNGSIEYHTREAL